MDKKVIGREIYYHSSYIEIEGDKKGVNHEEELPCLRGIEVMKSQQGLAINIQSGELSLIV